MQKTKNILIKIVGTAALPLVMYIIMYIVCSANGYRDIFVSQDTMMEILKKTCYAALVGMGLSTQILNGRFDFSGGITIILSAFIAGKLVEPKTADASPAYKLYIYIIMCIVIALILSMITAFVYKTLKMPMIICSIALTLVYESMPRFMFGGTGLQLFSKAEFNVLAAVPLVFIIWGIGAVVYFYFKDLSPYGVRARLLSNNQLTSVNIGINENKSLYATFIVSGILFGLAASIYGVQEWIKPDEIGNLSTTSVAFSNIVPVYMGMFIGLLSYGWVGVLAGAFTIQTLNKGLSILTNGDPLGYYNIFFGIFMLAFWTLSAEIDNIRRLMNYIKAKFSKSAAE